MTPSITTSAPITPLNPTLRLVAQHLVNGRDHQDISTRTGLSLHTVRQYVRDIRVSVHCPPRCKPPVLAHFLFTTRQAVPPAADRTAPELSPKQMLLLEAVAQHSTLHDIALAAKVVHADVRSALDELLDRAGAADTTQLVAFAHAWGLLGLQAVLGPLRRPSRPGG
ncbi:DNA-binding protein [Streptomyces sp. RTGN2]|uniref:DNA-binding protein n=1 Tax=Streptomyces sp. RTGN2 TaxID=3016525 RepID=UPI0025538170|nr:DNA-binding protein [Streptomyces sp. RTGN2]